MILCKYSKTDGAEFLAHLDILRHVGRTMRRSGIKVGFSQGYNPHMLIFMSAPMGLGIKSLAEYFVIDTDENPDSFKEKFNAFAPMGLRCVGAWYTPKKVGVASDIVKAEYFVTGINEFDVEEFLSRKEFVIQKKNGEIKDMRELIYSVKRENGGLKCVLGFGNGLRIEKFTEKLLEEFGGEEVTVIKTRGLTVDEKDFEDGLK